MSFLISVCVCCQETLEMLKKQINKGTNDVDEKVADKRLEKDGCVELFQVLRMKLQTEKETDRKKLCYFTDVANSTTQVSCYLEHSTFSKVV